MATAYRRISVAGFGVQKTSGLQGLRLQGLGLPGSRVTELLATGLWGMITVPLGREGHAEGWRRVCHAGDGQAGAWGSVNTRGLGLRVLLRGPGSKVWGLKVGGMRVEGL